MSSSSRPRELEQRCAMKRAGANGRRKGPYLFRLLAPRLAVRVVDLAVRVVALDHGHLVARQRNHRHAARAEEVQVVDLVLRGRRARDDDVGAALQVVAHDDLADRDAVLLRELREDGRVAHVRAVAVADGRVGLDEDAVLVAEGHDLALAPPRVVLNLVDGGVVWRGKGVWTRGEAWGRVARGGRRACSADLQP